MADSSNILAQLQKYNIDSSWLTNWLPKLSESEQKAALDALKAKFDAKDIGNPNEMEAAAHEAVNQARQAVGFNKDPSMLMTATGRPGDAQRLRDYFASDKVLKNDKAAQLKIVQDVLKQSPIPAAGGDVVGLAKAAHWQNLSPRDRYKYGYQDSDVKNLDSIKAQFHESDWSGVENYIDKLKGADKYVALQYVNQQTQGQQAFHHVDTKQILGGLPDAVHPPAKPAATDTSSAAPAPSTAQPQGAAAAQQLAPQPGATTVTDAQKQLYSYATGGQDFDAAYQNFIHNYGIAIQNQNAVTGAENPQGGTQLWTTGAYQPPSAGFTYGTPQRISAGDTQHQVSPAQFLGMQASSALKLSATALQTANSMWAANHSTTMPQGAAQAVVQKISSMSPSNQALLAADPQGLQSPSLGLGNILAKYAADHPEEAPATGSDDETYQLNLQRGASPIADVELGQYTNVAKAMDSLWQTNFHRTPTDTELKYFGGWNPDEIEGWVLSQQSPDNPNMTIGERQGFINAGNKASQQLFGTNIDSRMVDLMDGHFNPKQPPPPRPNMSLPPPPASNPSSTYANGAATK